MNVAQEVPGYVIDHNTLVEGMEPEEAILPAFLLATDVMGVKAVEFDDGSGVLGWWY